MFLWDWDQCAKRRNRISTEIVVPNFNGEALQQFWGLPWNACSSAFLGRPLVRVWESWPALTSDRHRSQQALVQPEGNFCSRNWWFCFLLDHRISRNSIVAGGNLFCKVYPRTHTVFPSSALMACMVGLILFRDTSGLRSILPRPPFSVVRHIYALALVSFYLHHQRCLPRFPPLHRPKSQ